jgi:hypothetical protein
MRKTEQLGIYQQLVVFGVPLISILVVTSRVLDPVNLPKMVLLVGLGFGLIPFIAQKISFTESKVKSLYLILQGLFVLWSAAVLIFAESPFTEKLYGVTGRFTGALTYLAFTLFALGIALNPSKIFYSRVLSGLYFVTIVNVVYCGIVILTNKDPIPWTNVYGQILGTFGNPNFISAFLGIGITVIFAKLLEQKQSIKILLLFVVLSFISFLEILDSQSRQGIVVTAIGCGGILAYKIFTLKLSNTVKITSVCLYLFLGVVAALGMLQIGPMTSLVYKISVSIRGAYWRAGWEIMSQNPIFGAGFDGFGDWYTRVRDERAMMVPGPDVFTNSAHNVFIEQGANGGMPLFAIYLLLQLLVLFCGLDFIRKNREFNYLFAASFFGWLGFTAQSIISINQIGLAIWGYVLGAITIGLYFESNVDMSETIGKNTKPKLNDRDNFSNLFTTIFVVIGLSLSTPAIYAESKWRAAVESKDLDNILLSGDRWPQSTARYIAAVKLLYENKLDDRALEFTRNGLVFNPNNPRLWYFLYQLPGSTSSEKEIAKEKLKLLDPRFAIK